MIDKHRTTLMQEAALVARDISAELAAQRPEDMEAIARMTEAGRIQFDVRVRDVLGGMPRIDLVAVTAEAERVIGSISVQRAKRIEPRN